MAHEDSHTLFVARWLALLNLNHHIEDWYTYRDNLFKEKREARQEKVYSRLYEFFTLLLEKYEEREQEFSETYDKVLDDIGVEEKLEVSI
jgi:hypothetical protein